MLHVLLAPNIQAEELPNPSEPLFGVSYNQESVAILFTAKTLVVKFRLVGVVSFEVRV